MLLVAGWLCSWVFCLSVCLSATLSVYDDVVWVCIYIFQKNAEIRNFPMFPVAFPLLKVRPDFADATTAMRCGLLSNLRISLIRRLLLSTHVLDRPNKIRRMS